VIIEERITSVSAIGRVEVVQVERRYPRGGGRVHKYSTLNIVAVNQSAYIHQQNYDIITTPPQLHNGALVLQTPTKYNTAN
jgi:hypothetical protein